MRRVVPAATGVAAVAAAMLGAACAGGLPPAAPASMATATLVGFARLDPHTYADGPTSGHFIAPANGVTPPFVDRVPVQGISGVIAGPAPGTFRVLVDNGFGSRANSPDVVLRAYAVRPAFRTATGGSGRVVPVGFDDGRPRRAFDAATRITLRDPERRLGFPLVADATSYPYAGTGPGAAGLPVDPQLRRARWLTGADLDPEEFVRDARGRYWIGEEFGPFLVVTDARGRVLAPPVAAPLPPPVLAARAGTAADGAVAAAYVRSPQHPGGLGPATARASAGFEGLAVTPDGRRLHAMLEAPLVDDPEAKRVWIYEFDPEAMRFTGRLHAYRLAPEGTHVGGITALDERRLLVIERDDSRGDPRDPARFPTPARHKKLYEIDLGAVGPDGYVAKREVADLLRIADPHDLDRDGDTRYTMPFVTIESVVRVAPRTVLVINDNNYPGNGGRSTTAPDATEFALIRLPP